MYTKPPIRLFTDQVQYNKQQYIPIELPNCISYFCAHSQKVLHKSHALKGKTGNCTMKPNQLEKTLDCEVHNENLISVYVK